MSNDGVFFNRNLARKIEEDGIDKAASVMSEYLTYGKIREKSFARRVLDAQYISEAELDQAVDHNFPIKIIPKEPEATAFTANFESEEVETHTKVEKYSIKFNSIKSERQIISLDELMTTPIALKDTLVDIAEKEIQRVEDLTFLKLADTALNNNDAVLATNGKIALKNGVLLPEDITAGKKLLTDERRAYRALLSEETWADTTWPATIIGDDLATQVHTEGWQHPKVLGLEWLVSVKRDLFRKDHSRFTGTTSATNEAGASTEQLVYLFCEPKFLGQFFVLRDMRVSTKLEGNIFSWFIWETIGMAIGNDLSVARLEMLTAQSKTAVFSSTT